MLLVVLLVLLVVLDLLPAKTSGTRARGGGSWADPLLVACVVIVTAAYCFFPTEIEPEHEGGQVTGTVSGVISVSLAVSRGLVVNAALDARARDAVEVREATIPPAIAGDHHKARCRAVEACLTGGRPGGCAAAAGAGGGHLGQQLAG